MPTKCNKAKNPCKICLETVTNKSGLQCQGACKKWVHFSCLNYTPGKINDIKKGIIKVTCPCLDCATVAPKEYRTDEPYSCTNVQCPSNLPRSCISDTCPSNQGGGALRLCEKSTCKNNKIQTAYDESPASAGVNCPSSSCSFKGDMGNRSNPGAEQAFNVVKQICTTVGQLSNQMNSLMNEMKTMVGGGGGRSAPKPQSGCDQPTNARDEARIKTCNCPNNPRY